MVVVHALHTHTFNQKLETKTSPQRTQ